MSSCEAVRQQKMPSTLEHDLCTDGKLCILANSRPGGSIIGSLRKVIKCVKSHQYQIKMKPQNFQQQQNSYIIVDYKYKKITFRKCSSNDIR